VHFPRDESPGALNPAWPATAPMSGTPRLLRGLHAQVVTQDMECKREEGV